MIYTRNKQSFKSKTVKAATTGTNSSKLSQNGISLVEELRQRLQNKNKKHQNIVMSQDAPNGYSATDRPKSSTPKKLTISKNFFNNPNQQKTFQNQESSQDSMKELSMDIHTHKKMTNQAKHSNNVMVTQKNQAQNQSNGPNPFSKIKKDPFIQLMNHKNSTHALNNQSNHISELENSRKQQNKLYQELNQYDDTSLMKQHNLQSVPYKQSSRRQGLDFEYCNEVKAIYESPIQGLTKSNYSNMSNSVQAQMKTSSKEVYENQVKKWGNRTLQSSDRTNQNTNIWIGNGANNNTKAELTHQAQKSNTENSIIPKLKRSQELCLISKTLNEAILSWSPSKNPSSSAQQQYLQLLQTQISTIKEELYKNGEQIQQLTHSNSKLSVSNQALSKENLKLKDSLYQADKKISQMGQNSFVIEKYERLFEKMRNLLIINAMEMIQTKNFIELNFTSSLNSSLVYSPQVPSKHSHIQSQTKHDKTNKGRSFLDQSDCHQRIQSINECLAKVQQTIEVSQVMVAINHQRLLDSLDKNSQYSRLEVRELTETINYKDKIIGKLKEEISEVKSKLALTKVTSDMSPVKQHKHNHNLDHIKPYSYVDEIHLLRHQINRLTQENCVFYGKYSQIKSQLQQKEPKRNTKNFPNHQTITEIQSLIHKLDKNQTNQLENSKLDYWTNNKTDKNKLTSPKSPKPNNFGIQNSKSKPNTNTNQAQKPKHLDFDRQTQRIKPSKQSKPSLIVTQTQLFPGRQKVSIKSRENFSSEKKGKTVEYSKEEFLELVREFKSSLSGLTPEKRHNSSKNNPCNNFPQTNHNSGKNGPYDFAEQDEIIELPTFRTPKQPKSQTNKQKSFNGSAAEKHLQSEIKSSQNLIQQQESNQGEYIETISRLEYEKEFLASERQNLLKENQKLIQRIKELQNSHQNNCMPILKQQIYKLKFQNHELVNRIVEAESQLISRQDQPCLKVSQLTSPSTELTKSLQSNEIQIHSLKRQNLQLHQKVQTLEVRQQQLTKIIESTRKQSQKHTQPQQQQLSYILAPSFQQLFTFLKKLPTEKHHYHQILLNMIEGYERKVSQLREENVMLKSRHKELQDLFSAFKDTFQKVFKHFNSQKNFNNHGQNFENQQNVIKITAEINKNMLMMEELSETYFSQVICPVVTLTPTNSSHYSHSAMIMNLQSRINYDLMFLRSLVQGIGQSDLELIESELSDYLKQLRTRIPTVLEREEYEESNQSSLNTSVVHEEEAQNALE